MCGLWASIGYDAPEAVITAVAHRGPDGQGGWHGQSTAGPVTLYHRRLSIYDIDPRAAQPMRSAASGAVLVFNGAIYNFRDLRRQAEACGARFQTESDTEVLLHLLDSEGVAALPRLNGMFAFVYVNPARSLLIAARDRFGVKPLYLQRTDSTLAMASEPKQLLATRAHAPSADADAVHDFLMFGVSDHGPTSFFSGITPLPPGHVLELSLDRPLPAERAPLPIRRWYHLPAAGHGDDGPDAAARLLRQRFEQAVRLRMVADVPVGSCLSGGIDSSAIVGAIGQLKPNEALHSVSAVYPGLPIDESRFIDLVLQAQPGLINHRVALGGADLACLIDRVIRHQDEPFASSSIVSQFAVFEAARANGLSVMIDGQGADELFGGYYPTYGAALADLLTAGRLPSLIRELRNIQTEQGPSLKRLAFWLGASLMPRSLVSRLRQAIGQLPMAQWMTDASGGYRLPLSGDGRDGSGASDSLSRKMVQSTSLPMLLRFADRNAMAHGVEARLPFLDVEVVETAMRLGGRYNLRAGQSKWIEREALSPFLPAAIRNRRDKIGFATPEDMWMRGAFADQALAGIDRVIDCFPGLLQADRVRRDARAMLAGSNTYDGSLWRLYCLGAWAEAYSVRG